MKKEEATKIIALTLADEWGEETPSRHTWGSARNLANKFEAEGQLASADNIIGYAVAGRDGDVIKTYATSHKQVAEKFAADATQDCKDAGVDWDYQVVAIIEVN